MDRILQRLALDVYRFSFDNIPSWWTEVHVLTTSTFFAQSAKNLRFDSEYCRNTVPRTPAGNFPSSGTRTSQSIPMQASSAWYAQHLRTQSSKSLGPSPGALQRVHSDHDLRSGLSPTRTQPVRPYDRAQGRNHTALAAYIRPERDGARGAKEMAQEDD